MNWYDYAIVIGGISVSWAISLILFARYVRTKPWDNKP